MLEEDSENRKRGWPASICALLALVVLLILIGDGPVGACGPDTDCKVGSRTYRIRMPEGAAAPVSALIHVHGYRGTAAAVMQSRGLAEIARDLGIALIAPQSAQLGWVLPNSPGRAALGEVDELAYFDALVADVSDRFQIDPKRVILSGFSAGGMMVWTLACHRGDRFAGFIPIAGTFWRPVPDACTTAPASVIHLHGDADPVVPLLGRPVRDTHQGEVPRAIAMYARHGAFGAPRRRDGVGGRLRCEERTNPAGKVFSFCLFAGGHAYDAAYIRDAWQRLTAPPSPIVDGR